MVNIRKARLSLDIKQADLAQKVGVAQATISAWEKGIKTPSAENLAALSDALGVTADYLLGRKSEDNYDKSTPAFTFEQMQAMAAKEGITLSRRDELDITKRIRELHDDLANPDTLMMSGGEKLDEESRQALLQLLEQVEIMSKILAKKKFTPKKYRKSENP